MAGGRVLGIPGNAESSARRGKRGGVVCRKRAVQGRQSTGERALRVVESPKCVGRGGGGGWFSTVFATPPPPVRVLGRALVGEK